MKKKFGIVIFCVIVIALIVLAMYMFLNKKESKYVDKCYQELRLLTYNNWKLESDKKELESQEDYSNIVINLSNDEKIKQMISENYNSLYNVKKEKVNFKVKSINNKNTKYKFSFACDELNKNQCEQISNMLWREVLSKLDKDYGVSGGHSIDNYYCK